MTTVEIAWLAGLMEGEGCFVFNGSPRFVLQMTDEDIVSRVRSLIAPKANIRILAIGGSRTKPVYNFAIAGSLAIQWMMIIYSFMGRRRKEKIREIIQKWHEMPGQTKEQFEKAFRKRSAVTAIAAARKISREEAEKIFNESMRVH